MMETFQKGTVGLFGVGLGYAMSISTTEVWLRILSLVVGIAVGLASFISICFSIGRKYQRWKDERAINPKDAANFNEETTTT